jgi:methionyl-tRNA formyltransferase
VRIACGNGILLVRELQLAGRKRLPAAEFLRGCRLEPGTVLE